MPVTEQAEQIHKSKKVIAITQGVGIILLILSVVVSSGATMLIMIAQQDVADQILDCLIPQGVCYQEKIQSTHQSSSVEVNLIVNYCSIKNPYSLTDARTCVLEEIKK